MDTFHAVSYDKIGDDSSKLAEKDACIVRQNNRKRESYTENKHFLGPVYTLNMPFLVTKFGQWIATGMIVLYFYSSFGGD